MKSVLSTKILLPHQKELLLNAGLHLVEYDAIKIEFIDFKSPKNVEFAVVTSKNAVLALLRKGIKVKNYYCVGEKTKALLEENDQNLLKMANNAQELGEFLQKNPVNGTIYFFCGNRRRQELPSLLTKAEIPFEEVITYETNLHIKKINRSFDAILLFSPSGVESYISVNSIGRAYCICIGSTTADAVMSHSKNIAIANTPTVESVVAKTVKTLL